ncbi:MAG: hypothetical protein ACJAUP_000386 [Cellvibrionaceae bacterium]|jgi:hypothetical protein
MLLARLSISTKLLLLSVLPLILLTSLLFDKGKELFDVQKNSFQTAVIIELAVKLDDIAHEHAIERGLTAGFLGRKDTKSIEKIVIQRKKSDQAVTELKTFLNASQRNLQNINVNIDQLIGLLKQKNIIHDKVDQLAMITMLLLIFHRLIKKRSIPWLY